MIEPFWMSAFLDLPEASFDVAVRYWQAVTGYHLSAPRGERREFATLVPSDGDDFLRVQRIGDGAARVHLDLHVADPRRAAQAVRDCGGAEVADRGYVVMRSPGGFAFCLVTHPAGVRPPPQVWDDGHASLVDQVCLYIPSARYEEECGFWAAVTGWPLRQSSDSEFRSLERPAGMPLRLLLQRLDEQSGPVRAHLDLAAEDRAAEVRRHATIGGVLEREHRQWTVMRDPAGSPYCITDRDPATGLAG